ncbi:MAG: DUF4154 domain-containing protein [Deltaproteobacteria bacterium]|nr:DUF4154 domain-containing protein [Deltaproteobacteria bacterium]
MHRRATSLLCLLAALAGAGPARADPELPPRTQALLLLRVLGYDRALTQRAGDRITIAVAWRAGDESQRDAMLEALRGAGSEFRVAGLPVRAVPVRWEPGEFERQLEEERPCAVLVVASLADEAAGLAPRFRRLRLLSATTSRAAVEAGLAIGLVVRRNGAAVVVNVAAARATSADLDATLFTVAEVVGLGGDRH